MVTHESTRGQSYQEIVNEWTLDDLLDANAVLNALDAANANMMREAERQRGR